MAVAGASRGDGRPRARLLERDGDLSALASVAEAAGGGNGQFVVIEGRAGVTGLRVLGARCSELEQDFAFGVVRQLFEPLLTAGAGEATAPLFTGAAGLAAPLFDPSAIAATEQSGDTSFAILHGLYWLAANAALSTPTALLLDDVHWCDRPSLRWLLHLVPRLDGSPLLLAVATRPPLQARESALLTELIADPAALLVRPSTLGAESVASLAREALGSEPDEGFRAACSGATGGNPLLLRALLDALAADGVSPSAANAPPVEAIGPEPVARMVSRRLSGLSSDANALVRAVAVLDHAADPKLASELAGIDEDAAGAAITTLADAEILHGEPRLEFAHPIIRTSVYEQLGATERTAAHRRAAALLIAARAEPEQAAAHLLAVAPEGDPAMVVALRSAAERALARGAATTAIAYLRRALSEAGESAVRGTVLAELGMAERGADLAAAAAHLREAVELSADAETRAQLALECGRALYFALDDRGAREVFTQGIELLGSRQEDLRELLEAELMHVSWFVPELYSGAPERLTRIDPESLAGGRAATCSSPCSHTTRPVSAGTVPAVLPSPSRRYEARRSRRGRRSVCTTRCWRWASPVSWRRPPPSGTARSARRADAGTCSPRSAR
jgi:hypothetical protein